MDTEQPKYSRTEISDEAKRNKVAEEIKTNNGGVDKKKTPEGKKELSQTWIQKANLTSEQKKAICDELLVTDIESTNPKELERRVIALQKHLGFAEKDCDGILGWKTLEKTDKMIEDQHKLSDEEGIDMDKSEKYGLDRVDEQARKEKERKELKTKTIGTPEYQEEMTALLQDAKDSGSDYAGTSDPSGTHNMMIDYAADGSVMGLKDQDNNTYNTLSGEWETPTEKTQRIAIEESKKIGTPEYIQFINDKINGMTEGNVDNFNDPADNNKIQVSNSGDENLIVQKGDKFWNQKGWVSREEYAKGNEKTQWYKGEMEKVITQQKGDFNALLKTPEGNTLYVDKGGEEFIRESNGAKEVWGSDDGWVKKELFDTLLTDESNSLYKKNLNRYISSNGLKGKLPDGVDYDFEKKTLTKIGNPSKQWNPNLSDGKWENFISDWESNTILLSSLKADSWTPIRKGENMVIEYFPYNDEAISRSTDQNGIRTYATLSGDIITYKDLPDNAKDNRIS